MCPTWDLKGLQKKGPVKGTKGPEEEGNTKVERKRMLSCCSADGQGIFRSWKRKKTIFLKSLEEGRPCLQPIGTNGLLLACTTGRKYMCVIFSCWFYENTLRIYGQHKLEIKSRYKVEWVGKSWGGTEERVDMKVHWADGKQSFSFIKMWIWEHALFKVLVFQTLSYLWSPNALPFNPSQIWKFPKTRLKAQHSNI